MELMKKLIKIFNQIRDIPYQIPLSLDKNAIDCDGKHKLLYEAFSKEGIECRYRVCSFLWSNLNLPKKIKNIPHTDKCEHLYLEIFIDKKWTTIDATWDSALSNILKVNYWDGKSDTEIAVPPSKIFSANKKTLSHCKTKQAVLKDIEENKNFYEALNNWMQANRG